MPQIEGVPKFESITQLFTVLGDLQKEKHVLVEKQGQAAAELSRVKNASEASEKEVFSSEIKIFID